MGNVLPNREEPKLREDSFNVLQLRKAMKLSENLTFQTQFRLFSSLLTYERVKKVTELTNKTSFTDREKLMALSLYKKNPRVYRMLTKIFVLPPCNVFHELTSKVFMERGLNKRIYVKLKRRVQKMAKVERMCVLLFDEVTITPKLNSNQQDFLISDKKLTKTLANHTLVFMIRLIFKKKNQPIAYKFSCRKITSNELKIIIQNIISDLQECGLKVMATVCDQNTRNIGAINKLIRETKEEFLKMNKIYPRDTFEVNGKEVVPLFDAPHLMKGLRNDLATKNLKCTINNEVKIVKWDHIMELFTGGRCSLDHVTRYHVIPKKINKIDASYAIQTLSRRYYAGFMGLKIKLGALPREYFDTVEVLLFIDKLFKSMNGSYNQWQSHKEDEPLHGLVTPKFIHEKEWTRSKFILNSMKFIMTKGKEVCTPTIDCWIRTLDNIKYLSRKLFVQYSIKGFWMCRFNMDPLVTFLKRLQIYGCRNINTYCLK